VPGEPTSGVRDACLGDDGALSAGGAVGAALSVGAVIVRIALAAFFAWVRSAAGSAAYPGGNWPISCPGI
jgi:hypothetical protein